MRETLGIGFPCGTYEHIFYVAGPIARFLRFDIVLALLQLLFAYKPMRRVLYRTVSQPT